jgi:hypothetical protein
MWFFDGNDFECEISSEPETECIGALPPRTKRATRGVRGPSTRGTEQQQQQQQGEEEASLPQGDVDEWIDEGPGAAEGPAAPAAAAGGRAAGNIVNPWAAAQAAQEQQKWDAIRPEIYRSYVEQLPDQVALAAELKLATKVALEQRLAAVQPCCRRCGSLDTMQVQQPACVLYIGTEYRFELQVPRYSCHVVGCDGTFAPSPFAAGCFPATPVASWDVVQSRPGQGARWLDTRLLQLADSLIFTGNRPAAMYSLAAVVHQQHALNGCSDSLGLEHFKRQLGEAVMVGNYCFCLQHNCPGTGAFLSLAALCLPVSLTTACLLFLRLPDVQEFGYLMCAILSLVSLGVEGVPSGPLAVCPCCSSEGAAVHMNFDFNYSLSHLAHCGTASVQQQPPNSELFLQGAQLAELLKDSTSGATAQVDPERACSDFDAARVMGRTSEKVSCALVLVACFCSSLQ